MFVDLKYITDFFRDKSVAIIGSAPTVLNNPKGYIDSHDIVVRVNNYKIFSENTGVRTDVHYSFYGSSIRKSREELINDGVKLCMCKCPNSQPIESEWHVKNNKKLGIDFRYIYKKRSDFWFCPVYVPTDDRFRNLYYALDNHIASTGFAAIWEISHLPEKKVYITGFDFFQSGVHNVNERWRPGDPNDPIGHRPDLEKKLLHKLVITHNNIELDKYLLREVNSLK